MVCCGVGVVRGVWPLDMEVFLGGVVDGKIETFSWGDDERVKFEFFDRYGLIPGER